MEFLQMNDSVLKHVVNNIFLPIQLPQEEDQSGAQGGTFVRLVADVLALLDMEELRQTKVMMESWGMVQQNSMDWNAVLRNIERGKTCALFLPMQNAALTVSIPADDHSTLATLAVFRVAARSSEVMGAPGVLSCIFPGWSVTTHADRVRNASFASQVADLANHTFEDMVPKSRKAGSSHAEERDVVDSRYVTEWLLGAVAGHSLITGVAGVKRVHKKIRDDVLWTDGSRLPWRRSGEYMAVKVVLQSTLMGGPLGETDGLLVYKLIMLKLMSVCLQNSLAKMDTDVILQMLSKIARRISKFEELAKQRPDKDHSPHRSIERKWMVNNVILQMLSKIARRISKFEELAKQSPPIKLSLHRCIERKWKEISVVVIDVRGKLNERWQSILNQEEEYSKINVDKCKLDFERDLRHSFETAWTHLEVAFSPTSAPRNPDLYDPPCFPRNLSRGWPDVDLLCRAGSCDELIPLHDIEVWVRDVLFIELQDDTDRPEAKLFKLLVKYINRAKRFYSGDRLGSSRMILTATTIVAVLDRLAGREFPLLHKYDAGVDISVLRFLLLPHRQDMEHLARLETYFAKRLAKMKFVSSLISEDVPSPNSFVVLQAQRDPEVAERKEQILEFARKERLKKLEELSKARKKHSELVRTVSTMTCDEGMNAYRHRSHPKKCKKCRLNKEAADMSVSVFEFPLPKTTHLQDAVVGELVAPTSSWKTLRDALHVLHRDVFGAQLLSCEKKGTWRSYKPLKRWVCTPKESPLITLGSTTKLFLVSHYRSLHPDKYRDKVFFKPNGFNLRLMEQSSSKLASTVTYENPSDVRSLTTLDADGVYKCLQWTMDGTSHTENEVLCKQVDCPPGLNLPEFHAFGTLRAGQRIQIRNLIRVLEMQTLSLSQPSVVNLISQSLWETGPPNDVRYRDSHLDLGNKKFARYALARLEFLIRNARDNWKDHLTLLSIVTVGARVLALSKPDWEVAAMGVLLQCRELADKWLNQMEEVLKRMMASPIHEIQRMRSKLVDVAAIAALTFDVDDGHVEALAIQGNEDVIYWLRALARIHDNVLLNSESKVSSFQQHLLRRVQLTALRLDKTLRRRLEDCLDGFVSRHWADASQGDTELPWKCFESPREHWWTTTFKHHSSSGHRSTLHVDTLRGSFLVNGLPVGRLPSAITSHRDYTRVFDSYVFEVQPAAASASTYVSVHPLKGSVFSFALDGNRLVVKDRRRDNHEFELFPSRFLDGDLPNSLIDNYSHWISRSGSAPRIFFRPVKFDDDHFADDAVPFEINLESRYVQDTQRYHKLVDIRSMSFKEVYDGVLHRLEFHSYVHVFVSSNSSDVHAELPRMGLSFQIREGVLWSREQPGCKVSEHQSLGTLIGLQNGVLLTEERGRRNDIIPKRSVIIPHTTALSSWMEIRPEFGERHPVVEIKDFQFSSPSFFVYDLDDRLRCLRAPASQAAWLYLALLHALTAYPLPDPFTGLTGAESAMRLLQSPRCWSCKPYDTISLSILQNIEKLAPRREWYPKHLQCMQKVTWPVGLFPSTALDAFRLLVERLIDGSNHLSVLFPSSEKSLPPLPPEASDLRWKSYWRSRSYLGQEALMSPEVEGDPPHLCLTGLNLSVDEGTNLKEHRAMRVLAEVGFQWRSAQCKPWPKLDSFGDHLILILLNRPSLIGAARRNVLPVQSTVSAWLKLAAGKDFADHWINLYNLARQVSKMKRQFEFTFLLTLLAFQDVDYRLLFPLLCVALHARDFESLDPPQYGRYEFTNEAAFNLAMVKEEIERHTILFTTWQWRSDAARIREQFCEDVESLDDHLRGVYCQTLAQDIQRLVAIAQISWWSWPNAAMSSSSVSVTTIEGSQALAGVSKLFTRWHKNKQLHKFLSSVQAKILVLSNRDTMALQPGPLELPVDIDVVRNIPPFSCQLPVTPLKLSSEECFEAEAIFRAGHFGRSIVVECQKVKQKAVMRDPHPSFLRADHTSSACQVSTVFKADLRQSWDQQHKLQTPPSLVVDIQELAANLRECKRKSSSLWKVLHEALMPCKEDLTSRTLQAAGLWRRVTPVVFLPWLVSPAGEALEESVRMALGALAVIWTLEQQAERCLRFFGTNDVALQKELANTSPRNWKPIDRPEWLLLELEGDYRMRKVQVDVTNAMLELESGRNSVFQLNMGEGKTSVIVPALCASISDGQQFARLTVLSALFRINFDALALKLGGLLHRRVYSFPSRRDMKLSADEVARMKTAYLDCIAERGVVVTRPEHRLSAQLMSLEHCRSGRGELRELLDFVNSKASDVLDESDLILQVKYQVVYTYGEQKNIGGGNLRWKLSQSVLRSARRHFGSMLDQFGWDAIEFKEAEEGRSAFPHIRLLNDELKTSMCERIAEDILDGRDEDLAIRELQRHQKELVRNFVLDDSITLEQVQGVLPQEGPLLHIVLILRGLLCYGVLMHALRMRWRVDYGVRSSGHPKMAVPFVAKDVPVERAEYGHPDVAIMLTQLSYYNSGLSDEQLLEAFQRLNKLSNQDHEYKRWVKDVNGGLPATLSDVNLDDFVQRKEKLFPLLRRNMRVIDFWLSTVVFPVECKQFGEKLVASAWDLCSGRHPISGFSGTKDTRLLLPISVTQRDLPELRGTDGIVIANLLREENQTYRNLPSHIGGRGILKHVIDHQARVLLDVGALMVDLSNRDVATTWLQMMPGKQEVEAAIYFNDRDNQIMAVDRDGHDAPLPLSPYHRKVGACVVYLDDVHTRGTDLKLPVGYHACVTLGRGITKDRLVQACMRMRMLGAGHSVSFWASHEVHTSIQSTTPDFDKRQLTSEDVLDWVTRNSVQAIKDGFRHWGAQGITHCRRQTVVRLASVGTMSLQTLGELNTQKEIIDLVECYGNVRRATLLPDIISKWLCTAARNMQNGAGLKTASAAEIMMDLGRPLVKKIEDYAASVECCAQVLDEDQERELEHELEEEEEKERPGAATPHVPHVSRDVLALASGRFNRRSLDFFPALEALRSCTSLWEHAEIAAWSSQFYVTREFATVVSQNSPIRGSDFLRPVAWVVVVDEAIVLLSSFEANCLIPKFRSREGSARLHMFAPRHREDQDLMLREDALVLPSVGSGEGMVYGLPLVAELLAFSGNAFFASKAEESAYCDFLGLCPRPRRRAQEDAFERGDIGLDGFVLPEKRDVVSPVLKVSCGFQRSPVGFVDQLLSARGWHGYPSSSHVGQILSFGRHASNLPGEALEDANRDEMTFSKSSRRRKMRQCSTCFRKKTCHLVASSLTLFTEEDFLALDRKGEDLLH